MLHGYKELEEEPKVLLVLSISNKWNIWIQYCLWTGVSAHICMVGFKNESDEIYNC